jgi:hypothetical protein
VCGSGLPPTCGDIAAIDLPLSFGGRGQLRDDYNSDQRVGKQTNKQNKTKQNKTKQNKTKQNNQSINQSKQTNKTTSYFTVLFPLRQSRCLCPQSSHVFQSAQQPNVAQYHATGLFCLFLADPPTKHFFRSPARL